MGGNAIKNSRRINLIEHNSIVIEIMHLFPEIRMIVSETFRDKTDFGDIDFIVEKTSKFDIKQLIKDRLGEDLEYKDNNCFFSFNYKNVQIDFNFASPEEYLSMYYYTGKGDLGNFIGRVARSLNFKYGHDGLSYECHLDDSYKLSVIVTRDMIKALEFLGYDSKKFLNGFDTEEDIFKYATSSKYFNPLYFSLENQSHNDRTRNKKRKMYQKMIKYIEDNNLISKPKLTDEERMMHYHRAIEIFGSSFDDEVNLKKEKYNKHQKFKKLFNGEIISELTGLTGKPLGQFIRDLKDKHTSEFFTLSDFVDEVIAGGPSYVRYIVAVQLTTR